MKELPIASEAEVTTGLKNKFKQVVVIYLTILDITVHNISS